MKLAIVVGHDKQSQGASSHKNLNMSEYAYGRHVSEMVQRYAKQKKIDCQVFLRDYIGISGAYEKVKAFKPDAVIELHFNAFDGSVKGTEVLYFDDHDRNSGDEQKFVNLILDKMYKVFGRGLLKGRRGPKEPKTRDERGWYNVSRVLACPSVLVEPFFGDNPDDAQLGKEKMSEYAHCLVDAFLEWRGEGKQNFAPDPNSMQVQAGVDSSQPNEKKKKKRGRPRKQRQADS